MFVSELDALFSVSKWYPGDPKIIPKNLNNIHIIQKVLPSKSSLDVSRIEKRITVPL